MAELVTGDELLEAVRRGTFIKGGDPDSAESVKYDFHLGPRILKAGYGAPLDATRLTETEKSALFVDPGEVVFVLSEERLELPSDMMAQLSPKRKMAHEGILTLGGFAIDPGYEGKLLVGLFNFSSTPWPLQPGKKLIAATFYKLDQQEVPAHPTVVERLNDFPDGLLAVMQKYQPVAIQSVADSVRRLHEELGALRTEVRSREQWYTRFEQSLENTSGQISELTRDLDAEKEVRRRGEDKLAEGLQDLKGSLSFLKGAAWFIGVLIGAAFLVGLAVLGAYLAHIIH